MDNNSSNRTGVQSVMQRGSGGSQKDANGLDSLSFPVENSKFNTRSMMRRANGSALIGEKPKGKPMFEEQKFCQLCNSEFKTLIKKRHHCRTCGKSVCGKCSKDKGENRICDMCITEDENKGLKELYENVLMSKQEGLQIMKDKIQTYELKAKEKRIQLENEQQKYTDTMDGLEKKKQTLKDKLKELKENLHLEIAQNDNLKKELEQKREENLKRKEDQYQITLELNRKMMILQEKKEKLQEKEIELDKIKQKLLKYQDEAN